jgi:uncharacterized membrane protein
MPEEKRPNRWIILSGLVFQMAAIIGVLTYAGYRLDMRQRASSTPTFTIILSLVGVAIALYVAIREVSKLSQDD